MPRKQGVNSAAEIANAFAMDNADLENAPILALGQIALDNVLHFARLKSVKVQDPVNRQLNWFVGVHGSLKTMTPFGGGIQRGGNATHGQIHN